MFYINANTILAAKGGEPSPLPEFIWDLNTELFDAELREWNFGIPVPTQWEAASAEWQNEVLNWEVI